MSKTPDKELKQGSLFAPEEKQKTPTAYDREYTHGPRNRGKVTKKKGGKK
jgi:hypothetical protein